MPGRPGVLCTVFHRILIPAAPAERAPLGSDQHAGRLPEAHAAPSGAAGDCSHRSELATLLEVDSIVAIVTPAETSQCRITRDEPAVVLNVRVSLCRPRGPAVRTHTVSHALPTSSPAIRSNSTST
ncbi:MAG: hypothetical protein JWO98_2022 [Frankiales bacterium]|nr:hypothetical protein [Frankiales bacterium]